LASSPIVERDYSPEVLALYRKRSGAVHVVEVAEAAAPERF
jgi:hypothetical protein